MPSRPGVTSALLPFLLFCSGTIALVYEVVWHRQFSLLFGSAAPATAAVLASYFAGLGLGSFAFGARAEKWASPLFAYAVLEFIIGAGVLASAPILSLYAKLYPVLTVKFSGAPTLLLGIKATLAFLAILVPTAAMGGTLPVLAELVDAGKERLGASVGWLYAVNTAGAAAGALLFPFFLLRGLGAQRTVFLCASVNIALAAVALWMRSRWPQPAKPEPDKSATESGLTFNGSVLLAAVSGAGNFALQVLWNRAFAQIHENSLYSFALIVAVFILALACGAQFARRFLRKHWPLKTALALAWVVGGILVAVAPQLFVRFTKGLAYLRAGSISESSDLLLLGTALVFVPTALLGMAMPLLLESAGGTSTRSAGDVTGRLLSVNIAGSVGGALLAGFIFPRTLGLWNSMIAVGALFAALGASVRLRSPIARLIIVVVAASLALLLANLTTPRVRLAANQNERLVALREGAYGIVAVTERGASRRLKLNNHYTLGGTFAVGDERTQAHIPLLLHPNPRKVVFLGYGTGITAGGALFHPGSEVQAVELVPEVIDLATRYFGEPNNQFRKSSKATLVADDARNFLRGTPQKFDVIVSDIVVPWQPGEAALYTAEHFTAAKQRLAPGGLFCAWVPMFQLGETEFEILLRTFLSVFPSSQLWRGDFSPNRPALALIGCERPLDAKAVDRRLSEMTPDPSNPHLTNARGFWMHFVGMLQGEDVQERRINSEDRPWLELLAPERETHRELFVGRPLVGWQSRLGNHAEKLTGEFSTEAAAGFKGGRLMTEFTLSTSECNRRRADELQAQIREVLGEETYRLVFGVQ